MPLSKVCGKCKVEKQADNFYKHNRMASGLSSYCIPCHKAHNITKKKIARANPEFRKKEQTAKKLYRERTIEQRAEYMKAWRIKNPTAGEDYYKANIADIKAKAKIYCELNKHKLNARTRKRQAAKLKRTPAWLTVEALQRMERAYEVAAICTKMSGFAWHVDHIVPLQGKTVSGLHVPWNLQIIPAKVNYSKNNKFGDTYATF